jgi:membrane associated rhomboid family serine protease
MHHLGAHTVLFGWLGALCALTVTLIKALYAATCINELLLASKEWVALVAQFKGE